MKDKDQKKAEKPDDPMQLKSSEFDDLMRHALGVPPEPKVVKKKATKKKG